jgi:hypothetical protein
MADAARIASIKLQKAQEFALISEIALDEGAYDAATSLAVSACINASDSMIVSVGMSTPSGANHRKAVTVLRQAVGLSASEQLAFALNYKDKAQYLAKYCTKLDAEAVLKRATRLIGKAEEMNHGPR